MKQVILLVALCIGMHAFSQDFSQWNYLVECVDVSQSKVIKISIAVNEKKQKIDIESLKKYAVHALLIKGVSGNGLCIAQPALLTKDQSEKHNSYLNKLLDKKGTYQKYIYAIEKIESSKASATDIKEPYRESAIITINKEKLRNDLQRDHVIAQLNDGF